MEFSETESCVESCVELASSISSQTVDVVNVAVRLRASSSGSRASSSGSREGDDRWLRESLA